MGRRAWLVRRRFIYELDGWRGLAVLYVSGVSLIMRMVETPVFGKELNRLLSDDEYRALQLALLFRPEQGNGYSGQWRPPQTAMETQRAR